MSGMELDRMMAGEEAPRASFEAYEPDEAVYREAKDWLLRLREQDRTTSPAFEAWKTADPAHEYAFAEVEALFKAFARPASQADYFPRRRRWLRPRVLLGAVGAVAAVLIAMIALPRLDVLPYLGADAVAYAGEMTQVRLADGSQVRLNTRSAIDADLRPDARNVTLRGGEAYFEVAKDKARPFTIRAGDAMVRVVGTKFNVRMDDDQAAVAVTEGLVRVWPAGHPDKSLALRPGQEALITALAVQLHAMDALKVEAWRRGQIVFLQAPLRIVVRELNRYRTAPILIANWALADNHVTAVLSTSDTDAAVRIIDRTVGVESVTLPTGHTILY